MCSCAVILSALVILVLAAEGAPSAHHHHLGVPGPGAHHYHQDVSMDKRAASSQNEESQADSQSDESQLDSQNESSTGTEESSTGTEESSTGTEESSTDTEESSTDTEESPTGTEESPTDTEESPTDTEESPTDTEESPTGTEESPTDTEESSTATEESPTDTEESSTDTEESSTGTEESSTGTEESPTGTEESPTGTEKSSTGTEESSTDTEESSTDTEESATDTEESPTDTEESSTSTEESSTDTEESSKDTEESTTGTEESSTGTGESSTGTEESPTNTEESPTDTEESSTDTEESSTDTEESPTGTEESSTGTEESSTDTEESATGTEESPTDTEESATRTEESSTDTEESPTDTEESSTGTEESSTATEESSTGTEESSTATEESPTGTEESPTDTEESSTATEESPTGTEESPTDTEESPTGTEESSTTTEENPTGTEESPTDTEESSTDTEESSTATEESPTGTEESSTDTEESATGTEESSTGTEESPTDTEESSTGTEESPTDTEESPTDTEESSTGTEESSTDTEESPTDKGMTGIMRCNSTTIISDVNFVLPTAEVGTQVHGECLGFYQGTWECKSVNGFAQWVNVECEITDDELMEALSPEAISADPASSMSVVVNMVEGGLVSPGAAVQMVEAIVSHVTSSLTAPIVIDPLTMLYKFAYLLQSFKKLPTEQRALLVSAVLVQLDTLALQLFEPGFIDAGVLKMNVTHTKFEGDIIGVSVNGDSIVLPGEELQSFTGQPAGKIASFYFSNLTDIFIDNETSSDDLELVSPVVSSAVRCGEGICNTMTAHFLAPVRISLTSPLNSSKKNQTRKCVFWKLSLHDVVGASHTGRWDSTGCVVNEQESTDESTVCECTHLTHFGILLSPGTPISDEDELRLTIIGYVGVAISLVAMSLTVIIHICLKSLWSLRTYVHIHLCLSLMAAQLLFVTAVDKTQNQVFCSVIAIALQYLFTTSFMWMLMEGVVLYLAVVKVFMGSKKKYILAFTILSYGLPALYLVLTVPLGYLLNGTWHYGNENACWLRYDTGFVWVFITPVLVILLANTGFFIMTLVVVRKHSKNKDGGVLKSTGRWLKCVISLVVIMGLTWSSGVVTMHSSLLFVLYIFTICVALQGLAIFIMFVLFTDQVRDALLMFVRRNVVSKSNWLNSHFDTQIEKMMSSEFKSQLKYRSTTVRKQPQYTPSAKLRSSMGYFNPHFNGQSSMNAEYKCSLSDSHADRCISTMSSTVSLFHNSESQFHDSESGSTSSKENLSTSPCTTTQMTLSEDVKEQECKLGSSVSDKLAFDEQVCSLRTSGSD